MVDHARRGTYQGTGEGVEQAVHPGRHAAPARDLGAARCEDPLPDVLPDHQPEEEKQEVGEDSLPPDGGEVEIGGGQGLPHPREAPSPHDYDGQEHEEDADRHDAELDDVRERDRPHAPGH
jgi:hypothetical protein